MATMTGSICHVVGDSSFGGGSKIVLELAEKAIAEGYQVSVVATDKEFIRRLSGIGAVCVPLDCVRRPINPVFDIRGAYRLMCHFRSTKYDLVHTHTTKAGMIGRLAAKYAGVPYILHTVHGFAFHEASGAVSTSAIAMLERLAATWCDRIVCVSHYHRDWALRLGIASPDKIMAIPNGITPPSLKLDYNRVDCRRQLGVDSHELLVVGVGRLAQQKGFCYLVDAAAKLDAAGLQCRFVLAGEGPERGALERQIKAAGVGDIFQLIGYHENVGELYLAADLIVQPSLWEGLSISLLEAMSMERPIITTDIGSNLEVIGDSEAAVLIPAADVDALVRSITDLAVDPESRNRISRSALSVFTEGYTVSRMLDAYIACYRGLMNPAEIADHD